MRLASTRVKYQRKLVCRMWETSKPKSLKKHENGERNEIDVTSTGCQRGRDGPQGLLFFSFYGNSGSMALGEIVPFILMFSSCDLFLCLFFITSDTRLITVICSYSYDILNGYLPILKRILFIWLLAFFDTLPIQAATRWKIIGFTGCNQVTEEQRLYWKVSQKSLVHANNPLNKQF